MFFLTNFIDELQFFYNSGRKREDLSAQQLQMLEAAWQNGLQSTKKEFAKQIEELAEATALNREKVEVIFFSLKYFLGSIWSPLCLSVHLSGKQIGFYMITCVGIFNIL